MAQITVYMNYVIFFQSETDYNFAVSVAGSNLLQMAPRDAATLFGIPYPYPSGNMDTIPKGIYFIFPFTPGSTINFPTGSGILVDDTVESILVPGQAGNPASIFPAGPDGLHVWSGTIIRSQGAGSSVDPPPTAIAQRRFAVGFEWSEFQLEGSGTSTTAATSRDASRTIDGKGFAIRGDTFAFFNITINVLRAALTSATSWERFYIRVRKLPTGANTLQFWKSRGNPAPNAGATMRLNSSGEIRLFNVNGIGTEFDKGVIFSPTLNEWNLVDVLIKYSDGTDARVSVYVNHVLAQSFIDNTAQGIMNSTTHVSTDLGRISGVDPEQEVDLDDWISADLPASFSASTLAQIDDHGIDWLLGSHVRKHWTDSASLVNWTPNSFGIANQGDNPVMHQVAELASTTSGAQIVGLTDALLLSQRDSIANVLGPVAACIGTTSQNAAGTDGSLGYKKAGAAAVLTVIDELAGFQQLRVGYVPSGMALPEEISPWSVVYQKSADANAATVRALVSVVEYLGVWGPEDDPLFNYPISRLTFLHNCNYANTQWGYVGSEPSMPVYAVGGTYTGNGTTNTITLPGPCHFLWIRNTNGGGSGVVIWLGPAIGAVLLGNRNVIPDLRVFSDILGNFQFQVVGNAQVLNQNTHTYQYIAFCDPGMRYNITGVYGHDSGSTTPKVNALINSSFLAQMGIVIPQNIASIVAGTQRPVFKGIGIGGNNARTLDAGGNLPNYMNFAAGVLNTLADAHQDFANMTYSLWRTADGGATGCGNVMVQLTSYVGNGTNPRNIPLTPLSGRVPLFVLVIPDSATFGFFRDPSHAGANSSNNANNGLSATAITAVAIDQITVNASLNSNGVTYSVFAICGATGGMTNGEYYPTYCVPTDGPWVAPSEPTSDIIVMGEGGLVLNGEPGLALLKSISGIYTLIPGKRNDTLIDRQTGQDSVDVEIPDPTFKTGYIGG